MSVFLASAVWSIFIEDGDVFHLYHARFLEP